VLVKVGKRLAVNNLPKQKFDVKRENLREVTELEVRRQYQIKISNRLSVSENLSDSEDINRVWENIKKNIKTSVKDSIGLNKLQRHFLWFDEECLVLYHRKQANLQ
jgi:polyribonucleotide nucleotidyltransferase